MWHNLLWRSSAALYWFRNSQLLTEYIVLWNVSTPAVVPRVTINQFGTHWQPDRSLSVTWDEEWWDILWPIYVVMERCRFRITLLQNLRSKVLSLKLLFTQQYRTREETLHIVYDCRYCQTFEYSTLITSLKLKMFFLHSRKSMDFKNEVLTSSRKIFDDLCYKCDTLLSVY